MARRIYPPPEPLEHLIVSVELLPDRTLPLEERLARTRARETWFREQGLSDAPGDRVRRRNAEIRGREATGLPRPPEPPDPRDYFSHLFSMGADERFSHRGSSACRAGRPR